MKKVAISSLILVGIFVPVKNIYAKDTTLAAKIGTLKLGVESQQSFTDSITLRTTVKTFDYAEDFLTSSAAIADYHPGFGGFRLSAGLFYHTKTNSAMVVSENIGSTTFNNEPFLPLCGSLLRSKNIGYQRITPYLGFGWGFSPTNNSNWSFGVDIGMFYQNPQETDMTEQDGDSLTARYKTLQSELTQEENFLDTLERLGWYPALSAGVTFKF